LPVFSLLHYLVFYYGMSGMGFFQGFHEIYLRVNSQIGDRSRSSIWQSLSVEGNFLNFFATTSTLLIAAIGLFKSLWRREKMDLLFLFWFLGIFFSITLVIRIDLKEARYMIPALPALYYFFLLGINLIWQWLTKLLARASPALRVAMLTAFSL